MLPGNMEEEASHPQKGSVIQMNSLPPKAHHLSLLFQRASQGLQVAIIVMIMIIMVYLIDLWDPFSSHKLHYLQLLFRVS